MSVKGIGVCFALEKGGDRESERTGNCNFLILRDRTCCVRIMGQERRIEVILCTNISAIALDRKRQLCVLRGTVVIHARWLRKEGEMHLSADLHLKSIRLNHVLDNHPRITIDSRKAEI